MISYLGPCLFKKKGHLPHTSMRDGSVESLGHMPTLRQTVLNMLLKFRGRIEGYGSRDASMFEDWPKTSSSCYKLEEELAFQADYQMCESYQRLYIRAWKASSGATKGVLD